MTYAETYKQGVKVLEDAKVPEAALDARLLLEFVCDTNRNTLLVHGDREVTDAEAAKYEEVLAVRAKRIPIQQIMGVQEFMGLEFAVNEHVLIPRQDTEILVEEVLKHIHDGMRVLDMCTGSGCILVSLMHYSNDCSGVGADLSTEALRVARSNAEKLLSAEKSVEFIQSDLFEQITGKFEIIVSNPPYIRPDVIETLMPEVRDHEPMMALDGGADGLDFYREIVSGSKEYLAGGGMLFFEIGYDQGEDVKTLMEQAGFAEVNVVQDYAGLDRVVYGTYL
ncbi:MAG: peptide chain release factor N(5)-glutamine methyltransferase [Lachnospiraceae bacterium]|nr:peptide chain release factor N(5)-glutamine methyltransferase [Lachnospiraceae bacterium]